MNMENYEQIQVPEDVIGDQAAYLQPEMKVKLSVYEGIAVAIELPQRATLEVVETEPVDQGPDRVVVLQARRCCRTACAPWCRRHIEPAPASW